MPASRGAGDRFDDGQIIKRRAALRVDRGVGRRDEAVNISTSLGF
jgi:hypothetical protein